MNKNNLFIAICFLLFFALAVRLLPHAPNMTPITAIAFTGSLYLGRKWAIILPLVALFLSDLMIGFYDWKIMVSVYGSFALISLLSFISTKYKSAMPIGLSIIGASFLFFFITNSAVWAFSPWYEKTISGLLYSYELGLPFLKNMLVGDILYTTALVMVFEFIIAFNTFRRTAIQRKQVTV